LDLGLEVALVGMVGDDSKGNDLQRLLNQKKFHDLKVFSVKNRPTVEKVRIIARNQQLLRLDNEDLREIDIDLSHNFLEQIKEIIPEYQAVIISDYAKGFFNADLLQGIIKFCQEKNIFTLVDPKPVHKEYYHGACLITPNLIEAEKITGIIYYDNDANVIKMGKKIQKDLNCQRVIITMGDRGMKIFDNSDIYHISTVVRQVYDPSGAGDTVIAVIAASIVQGASLKQAGMLANYAAGIVIEKFGTATIGLAELKKVISSMNYE
jgi:D-beta-D-heptose 7-phosphate kinase/D-beta-D-heptose 1-phosphate adenosyltransferase